MDRRISIVVAAGVAIVSMSCDLEHVLPDDSPSDAAPCDFSVGLGYGFENRRVRVIVDGVETIDTMGTHDLEIHGQLLGTTMLADGVSADRVATVVVRLDELPPFECRLDLTAGRYIHVNHGADGFAVYNTRHLVYE